jgi:tetratricopeptide (TPR) repeat protein
MLNSLTDPASNRRGREMWKQYSQKRLEPFLAAVRANPHDARAHYGVGLLRLLGSEGTKASLRAALRPANRSAALQAGSAEIHALLAMIHYQLDDPKRALASAREAARLAPRDRDYANFLLAMLAAAGRMEEFRARLPVAAKLFGVDLRKTAAELRKVHFRASAENVYLNTFPHARNFLRSRLETEAERIEKIYAPGRVEAQQREELAHAFASRKAIRIARSRVPAPLRPLIPLARKWGIGDDADRGLLTRRMTRAERTELRKGLPVRVRREIDRWLGTFTPVSMTGEAAAFLYLLEAYEEVV